MPFVITVESADGHSAAQLDFLLFPGRREAQAWCRRKNARERQLGNLQFGFRHVSPSAVAPHPASRSAGRRP